LKLKADFPSESALKAAADKLGCRVETIKAIAEVEAGPFGAFLDTGEPVILFEPHIFSRLTGGRFDGYTINLAKIPESKQPIPNSWILISYPAWRMDQYGPLSAQHKRLQGAAKLNRDAALKSCSWGLYQLMGFNHKLCGHETIQSFVNAMYQSVDRHLDALVSFVLSDPRKVKAIRDRDAKTFASLFNGVSYAKNKYDTRLIAAGF
jgi:hypothetical protein